MISKIINIIKSLTLAKISYYIRLHIIPTNMPNQETTESQSNENDVAIDAQELQLYIQILDEAIQDDKPSLVPNAGRHHAAIMYSKMFDATKKEIFLVVRNFNGVIADQDWYYDSLKKCLEKENINVKVLILESANEKSRSFNLLKHYHINSGKVSIKVCHKNEIAADAINSIKSEFLLKNNVFNWAIFDDDMYRLEVNPHTYGAIGGIHQKDTVAKLKRLFSKTFDSAVPY